MSGSPGVGGAGITSSPDASDDEPRSHAPRTTRRRLLTGAAAVGGAGLVAGLAVATGVVDPPARFRRRFSGDGPTALIPDAEVGEVRLERIRSDARGQEVGLFTAVPAGFGDGAGLPVCLVLHGASATTDDLARFGYPEFLTATVESGAPPFVLIGVDGGQSRWEGGAGDDPQRMLRDEAPAWCVERGFDSDRIAVHGWSMGGYGSLLLAALNPEWLRAVAVLSPAVGGGLLATRVGELDGDRIGVWCGTDDSVFDSVEEFVATIPGGPAVTGFGPGYHTRGYWNTVIPDALAFVASSLTDR